MKNTCHSMLESSVVRRLILSSKQVKMFFLPLLKLLNYSTIKTESWFILCLLTNLLSGLSLQLQTREKCNGWLRLALRLLLIHGSRSTTLRSTKPKGMKSFPVSKDNTCLHFSLFCLTQFGQESTLQPTVCLTVPATTEETKPCLTSYGIVH